MQGGLDRPILIQMRAKHFIFISIALHGSLMLLSQLLPPKPHSNNTTEIEFLQKPSSLEKLQDKSLVRSAQLPEKLKVKEILKKALLTSEDLVRVKKETRAALNGLTKNQVSASTKSPQNKESAQELLRNASDDLKAWQILNERNASTFGDIVSSDIPLGNMTALNTDRNTFYSFYSRVEDLTRHRWDSRIQNSVNSFSNETRQLLNQRKYWITQIEFLLNKNGELVNALIMKESGIPAFDMAAVNAFKDARIFPNPPREMVQPDGFIHLKYSFHVHWTPLHIAQPQE